MFEAATKKEYAKWNKLCDHHVALRLKVGFHLRISINRINIRRRSRVLLSRAFCWEIFLTKDTNLNILRRLRMSAYAYAKVKTSLYCLHRKWISPNKLKTIFFVKSVYSCCRLAKGRLIGHSVLKNSKLWWIIDRTKERNSHRTNC